MFLHVCVILFTGGVSGQGEPPGRENPPPRQGEPPSPGRENPPPRAGRAPLEAEPPPAGRTPTGSRLQHTVNERPVHILLECILVVIIIWMTVGSKEHSFLNPTSRYLLIPQTLHLSSDQRAKLAYPLSYSSLHISPNKRTMMLILQLVPSK